MTANRPPLVSAREHYDRLAAEGHDPVEDPAPLRRYMARWDGPPFYAALEPLAGAAVLEVGVGTGRVALELLARGCGRFTGIDLAPLALQRARAHLGDDPRIELLVADAEAFFRPEAFDAAASVLTFCHIADKPRALRNLVASLKHGGRLVLSISSYAQTELDFGPRRVALHPAPPEAYLDWLRALGCAVGPLVPLFTDADDAAVLVTAVKPRA